MKQVFLALFLMVVTIGASARADVKAPGGKTIDCYCTDRRGDRVELGEIICLQVDGRMFMAQCQMSLNVPMWREVQEGCLSSRFDLRPPAGDALGIHPQI